MTLPHDDCGEVAELLGAYAIDALDHEEAAIVERHLQGCPRCSQEVAAHRETVGLLANVGGEAPEGVWEAIASRLTTPAEARRDTDPAVDLANYRAPARRRPTRWAAAALATAAVVAAGVLIGVLSARVDHLNHRVNQLAAAAREAAAVPGLEAALTDPTATHLVLESTGPRATPLAQLVITRSGASYLVGGRLPALPATNTYQLWSVISGRAISVAVLGRNPTTAPFSVDPAITASAYLVSVEPSGGVVAPTTSPVAHATA